LGVVNNDEPISQFRQELENLEYIFNFTEEMAFQLSSTEYELFHAVQPVDFVRYTSCNLTSTFVGDNPSPVRNLVKRLMEVSSWVAHILTELEAQDNRKIAFAAVLRMI
ncbi:hypothetical protein AB6A40_004127, partial [Gnathostoma spinigerum]